MKKFSIALFDKTEQNEIYSLETDGVHFQDAFGIVFEKAAELNLADFRIDIYKLDNLGQSELEPTESYNIQKNSI